MKQESKTTPKAAADHAKEQAAAFEKATTAFQKQEFALAKALFGQAAGGPAVELSHSALMHVKMCERRMGGQTPVAKSAEDLYTLGISLLNRGDFQAAQDALVKALSQKPEADHLHYAMALCAGQQGDVPLAANHLRRAIELQPGNRIAALNDADFHAIAQHGAIRELLNGERHNAG